MQAGIYKNLRGKSYTPWDKGWGIKDYIPKGYYILEYQKILTSKGRPYYITNIISGEVHLLLITNHKVKRFWKQVST